MRPLGGKLFLPAGSFLEVFSTLGMKKFLYPTSGSFRNPLFLITEKKQRTKNQQLFDEHLA